MHIRLIAVAKDEGAYIPEWVFHHLHFGFDSIEIYTNNIKDNTSRIIKKISNSFPVEGICADYVFSSIHSSYQNMIYGIALEKAKLEGIEYVMFLDIDEFWTPLNFEASIKKYLQHRSFPEIMAFPWAMKIDLEEFSPPYSQSTAFRITPRVKTILNTSVEINRMEVHGVNAVNNNCILPCGSVFLQPGQYEIDMEKVYQELPSAFINHRYCRSEMEYISMLGRGKLGEVNIKQKPERKRFNTNRVGFMTPSKFDHQFNIPPEKYLSYEQQYNKFINSLDIANMLEDSRNFIRERYQRVLNQANEASDDELPHYKMALFNLSNPEIKLSLEKIKARIASLKQA